MFDFTKFPNGLCSHFETLNESDKEILLDELAKELEEFEKAIENATPIDWEKDKPKEGEPCGSNCGCYPEEVVNRFFPQ